MASMQLPARAVRVDALVDFVEEHDLWKVSTKEMIERLFQPSMCFLSAAEAFFAPSQLGEADVYVSHNWDSTFGCIVAAVASFIGDMVHEHNEFHPKDADTVNVSVGKRITRKIVTRSSNHRSMFGVEMKAYAWIDAIGLSHFEEYIHEVPTIPRCLFPGNADLLMLVVIEYNADDRGEEVQRVPLHSLIDIAHIIMELEARQNEQKLHRKQEALTGASPSSLSKNKHLERCRPRNVVFIRCGSSSCMDYTNLVNMEIRKAVIAASKVCMPGTVSSAGSAKKKDRADRFNTSAPLKYAVRTEKMREEYMKWAHTIISDGTINTDHFGSGYECINRICRRFVGNMLCLES